MKIDWTQPLTDLSGATISDEQGRPITLGKTAIHALLTVRETVAAQEKFERFLVAGKVHANADITLEEATLIKQATGEVLTPLAMGVIWQALEGNSG